MNPLVKKDILNILREACAFLKAGEVFRLKDLSDQIIHSATIYQDKDSITLAVTIYSLSKIYQKEVDPFVIPAIEGAILALEEGRLNNYDRQIKSIIKSIEKKNGQTKFYVQEVLERAQIKKGSKIFEHGISLAQVAESIGISLWDLMQYVGQTRIIDTIDQKNDMKERLEFTRKMFS
jgi:uncharacterized protein (UPF0179 family)